MLPFPYMPGSGFDLKASARAEMFREGFDPDWSSEALAQASALKSGSGAPSDNGARDMRGLLWSSIDNQSSRDLDQIEFAERTSTGIRVLVGIADVDATLSIGSPIDQHAAAQTTTVYTAVWTFSMLPEQLSTDLTSLNENADRLAVVVEMLIDDAGSLASSDIYRALVRNRAQLTYEDVGPWLEGKVAAPPKASRSAELLAQLKLQDEAATKLRSRRHQLGAINLDRVEAQPVMVDGAVTAVEARKKNRATDLIEDFMIAANQVMAETLSRLGVSNIRRVVKAPERWSRICEIAARSGTTLPRVPDSAALAAFLAEQKVKDPLHYADLSLAIVKLMGPGEYVVSRPGDPPEGHFGLATHDYTHSTAPNRRFADLVTQRLLKSALLSQSSAYSDEQLSKIAKDCTVKEDAARKVERIMGKRVAATAYQNRTGESFDAVVTGVTPKGVFVRVIHPPLEGRLMRGEGGVDVGDQIHVTLLSTDPQQGYIDFGR